MKVRLLKNEDGTVSVLVEPGRRSGKQARMLRKIAHKDVRRRVEEALEEVAQELPREPF